MKELKEFNEFENNLKEFKEKYDNVTYDLTDAKQEKQARSDKFSIGKICAKLKAKHKEIKAPVLELSKKIDARKNELETELRKVQNKIGYQIQKHEDEIQAHKDMLQDKINVISFATDFDISNPISSDYELRILALKKIVIDESYEHRQENAENERTRILEKLERLYVEKLKQEKDAKELVELREKQAIQEQKDHDTRIAKEAAENARIEAERQSELKIKQAEAEALRIKQENEQALIRAEQEKKQAIENERLRIEREQQDKANHEAELLRAENTKKAKANHRKKIHVQAKGALVNNGFDEDVANNIVTLIKDGMIDNVSIEY